MGMSRSDRALWASARSLADLGDLTARWLEGGITSQPGYMPGCGPDEETAGLVPVLAALNRAGFVTSGSQPGGTGCDWRQRAAVEGLTDAATLARLGASAIAAGMIVIAHPPAPPPRWRCCYARAMVVTLDTGRPYTSFGVQRPRRDLRDAHIGYGICHKDAVRALYGAWQVTIADPVWGRSGRLWPALATAASLRAAS